jgi:hypothetical protein
LAIDKWWGCCGEGEKNLSNFSPFSTYFPRVDTWLNMSRCNLLHWIVKVIVLDGKLLILYTCGISYH